MGPIMQLAVNRLGWANSTRVLAGMLSLCTIGSLLYRVPYQNNKTAEKVEREEKPQRPPIFDISVFWNKAFLVWCISLSTFMMGYFVPFVHLVSDYIFFPFAKKWKLFDMGTFMSQEDALVLISTKDNCTTR